MCSNQCCKLTRVTREKKSRLVLLTLDECRERSGGMEVDGVKLAFGLFASKQLREITQDRVERI